MQLETIRAVLTADSGQFITGMNRAQGSLGRLTQTSAQSHKAMNILKSGMVGLAAQATGTTGPLSKLSQGLLLFGGGSTLVLGVAAGIAAIALAYDAFTREAREAAKANDELALSLGKISAHGRLIPERVKLKELEDALAIAQAGTRQAGPDFDIVVRDEEKIAKLTRQIAQQKQVILDLERQSSGEMARQTHEIDMQNYRLQLRIADLKEMTAAASRAKDQIIELGKDPAFTARERLEDSLNALGPKVAFNLQQTGLPEEVRDFGVSLGRQFIMGMLEGIDSMRDLFKMVVMSLLDFGIGAILNSVIPGAGFLPTAKGTDVIPKASMGLNVSGMPTAATPMAAARDAQWQSFLRESILVAGSQGFRG